MDNTTNGPGGGNAGTLREAARAAARRAHETGNVEVEKLCADVEELIARLGEPADARVAHLCARVAAAVANARQVLNSRAARVQRQAHDAFVASDSYVHGQPWRAIGAAGVAGLVLGLLVFRR